MERYYEDLREDLINAIQERALMGVTDWNIDYECSMQDLVDRDELLLQKELRKTNHTIEMTNSEHMINFYLTNAPRETMEEALDNTSESRYFTWYIDEYEEAEDEDYDGDIKLELTVDLEQLPLELGTSEEYFEDEMIRHYVDKDEKKALKIIQKYEEKIREGKLSVTEAIDQILKGKS